MEDLQIFMHIYMYELEVWLNEHYEEVLDISFQSDEANTDRPLKEYLKNVIESQCNGISKFRDVEELVLYKNETESLQLTVSESIKAISIEQVLLPEEITPSIKQTIQRKKNSVFTNPDLCLVLNNNGKIDFETIELKSTKIDAIPGSSIQQVVPDEWVIFVKHGRSHAQIATGQYLHAINAKMQFPDRSPRPQVSFRELKNWSNDCRGKRGNIVEYVSSDDDALKYELLTDWQEVLAKRWVEIVLRDKAREHEPWFNNNLRKFVVEFLNHYDDMTTNEQKEYKRNLESIIE